jgi:hypothetical protein
MAATASPRAVNSHRVTFLKTRDAFSKLRYPSGIFMAEGEAAAETEIFFHHVQVGMAHARTTDLYQDLAGAGDRFNNISDLSGLTDTNKPYCSHD